MPYDCLRDFITKLEKSGNLRRISHPVSPHLEMTEISRRVLREGGSALLFENAVREDGSPYGMPVLTNLFGTIERVAMGMGRKPDELRELGQTLAFLRQPEPPGGWKEAMNMMPLLRTVMTMKPRATSSAPCQDIVLEGDDIDLSRFPVQTCWPEDAAPLITWPLVVTRGPKPRESRSDNYNLGIYRMQVIGHNKAIMRWLAHRGGAQQFARWCGETDEPYPIAAVIGADPGVMLAAVTPVPDTFSEYQFAGLLRGKRLELTDCKTVPLQVPAKAEIVLEGYIEQGETAPEGPFGDHTGHYNEVEHFPVMTITAITMRRDAIYHSTYTGKPPDEPSILGEAFNEIFIPLITQQFPEIVDFWLPPEGCSYRIAVVSIRKAYAGHARRVMMGVWSYLRQFMYTKFVIIVDDTVDCRDWKEVMWAISTNVDPARDVMMTENTPIDYLDFASPVSGLGSKMGIDATAKIPPETSRKWGREISMSEDVIARIDDIWYELGLN